MPVGEESSASGYKKVASFNVLDSVLVEKYKCEQTGLSVVIAQVGGPIVNGYLCLATEAHDDDGLPHTLEHLIFMGCENYPYKGILDMLANRCMSYGTNAWTDVDHTAYTVSNAGSEGFLTLLPIFLEHILFASLTDSSYITEVYHVDGDGHDSGVVYCEMQAIEFTGESIAMCELLREMYPGHCGYKSETGGKTGNLRTSTSNEKVRAYHKAFYRPENLQIIICGQVLSEEVFAVLEPVRELIRRKKKHLTSFERPWQCQVPPLNQSVVKNVLYADDDAEIGMVYVSWRGPSAVTEIYRLLGVTLLMEYLTESSVSLLQQAFIEREDPYCSKVSYCCLENSVSCFWLSFSGVPKENLPLIHPECIKVLASLEKIDMDRMQTVVDRRRLEVLDNLESNPGDAFAFLVIPDFLYGNTEEDLRQRLYQVDQLNKIKTEPESFWLDLVNSYFVNKPSVTVIAAPSIEQREKLAEIEKNRIAERKVALGEEGLKKKAKELEKSKADNEVPPPPEVLESVKIPDVNKIKFHSIKPYCNYAPDYYPEIPSSLPEFPLDQLPFRMELDDINSRFVTILGLFQVNNIDADLLPLLPLFLEVLLVSPMKRDGVIIPYEEVVTMLNKDTLTAGMFLGLGGYPMSPGQFSENMYILLKVEPEKYKLGVKWLGELLYQTQFTVERLKVAANKMVRSVAKLKRSGNKMTKMVLNEMLYSKDSMRRTANFLRQHIFLTKILEDLDNESEAQNIVKNMEKLRTQLTNADNVTVHMAANMPTLSSQKNLLQPWTDYFLPHLPKPNKTDPRYESDKRYCFSMEKNQEGTPRHCMIGLGSVESSFMCQAAPGIDDYEHPDLPALMVLINYVTQMEGAMFRQIRGQGYAYGYSIYESPAVGLIYLTLFRCTNPCAAYKETLTILKEAVDGGKWDAQMLASAKSSLIFEVIQKEKDLADVIHESVVSYFKRIKHDYNRNLLEKIAAVEEKDLDRIAANYFGKFLQPELCKSVLVCHSSKVEERKKEFEGCGLHFVAVENLEESFIVK